MTFRIVLSVTVVLVLAAVLFPVFAKARVGGGPTSRTLMAIRQWTPAVLLYAEDADGVLPGAGWRHRMPPHRAFAIGEEIKIAMNMDVAGKRLAEIAAPSRTVLLFGSTTNRDLGGHSDVDWNDRSLRRPGASFSYVNGGVSFVEIQLPRVRFSPYDDR